MVNTDVSNNFITTLFDYLFVLILSLFYNSWGADHSAKNWGSNWGYSGSIPCNVHQVPPVPFWQVQDPLWPEREWCPVHPLRGWGGPVEALNCGSIFTPPLPSHPCQVLVPGLDYLWTANYSHQSYRNLLFSASLLSFTLTQACTNAHTQINEHIWRIVPSPWCCHQVKQTWLEKVAEKLS